MEYIGQQCAARSLGPANSLVTMLISTLIKVHCNTSAPEMWPPDYGPDALKDGLEPFDFIVVGAGSAGSVVASRLAENPDHHVLLLEAGGDPPMESEIPGLAFTTYNTKYDWQYATTTNGLSCLAMQDESCTWRKGKMLGGSSGINVMSYLRGNAKDYDIWEDEGNPTWGWRDVLPFFKKSEQCRGENRYGMHGTSGPLNIEPFMSSKHDQYLILEASAELGHKQVDEFVEGNYLGFGFVYGTLKDGRRESTAKAYLTETKPNLHIIKNALVEKINFQSDLSAESVNFIVNDTHKFEAKATKEIILSAGAIETPKLLMLSGIGPKTHLANIDIPLLKDLPVGENLQDHCAVTLFIKLARTYYLSKEMQLLDSVYNQWIHRNGPYGNAALDLAGFVSTKRSTRYPDIQYQFIPIGNISQLDIGYKPEVVRSLAKQISSSDRVLKVEVALLTPRSKGFVRLDSQNFKEPPLIIPNTFQKDSDIKTIVRGIRDILDFERTKTFDRMHGRFIRVDLPACDTLRYKTTKYWECYIKYMTSSMYHAAGTAKMGPANDHSAVVDPELKVKGCKKLRVIDASVMPNIVSGDLNAPTIMVAEKGAHFIKESWRQP